MSAIDQAENTVGVAGPQSAHADTPSRHPRPTIFVECTHTYHSPLNTGIQRVVRNILRNAPHVARAYGYDVVPVIVEANRFCFADAGQVLSDKHAAPPASPVPAPPPGVRAHVLRATRGLWRATLRILTFVLPFPSVKAFLYAPPHTPGLARTLLVLARPFRRRDEPSAHADDEAPRCLEDYDRCDGSILLLLDSSWTIPIWPGTRRFKERGGIVVGVVYDLIPISHSHTSVPELTLAFKAWIAEHLRWTDGFVCISKSTADTLADYAHTATGDTTALPRSEIDFFYLGSELDFSNADDPVRPQVQDIFAAERHVFLMVGTIEPRKMHAFTLDAFDLFWAQGGDATLVIVGRQTWKMEAFLDRAALHPELGRRLFVLRDATDAELDHCYINASSLVIASEIEGFGLPVVEAFQRGLRVMCSDIPVFREIADGRATFFSLSDPANLTACISAFCNRVDVADRRQRLAQSWITWAQSTEQLLAAATRVQPRRRALPRIAG